MKSKFIELVGIKLRPSKEEVKTLQKVDNREGRKNRTEKKQAKRVKEKNETTDKDMRKYFKVKKARMRNLNLTWVVREKTDLYLKDTISNIVS